ncbi:MAG TPA: HlyD family secretion protein [Gemmatimonadaceae bacterium]|nr:HlyD family secretion protein [Gemmatimonadaceae bacterium]
MATATQPQSTTPRPSATDVPAAASSNKRRIVLGLVILAALLGLGWGLKQWLYGRAHETTDNAQVDGHLVPVLAKVSGYVTAVNAAENEHVRADSTLVRIDEREYAVRVAQADADLAASRAAAGGRGQEGQAEAAVQNAAGQRAALDAGILSARANAVRAQADLERIRELAAKQVVSRQQLDAAQAAADAARAQLVAAQRQAGAAGAGVANAQAGVRLAQARLAASQAARDNAALQLSYTRVTAPVTGVVSRKQVEVGQLVQAGQPLLTVVSDTGVWVTANFKETQLVDLKVGQPVELEVDAYGGCTAEGKVESLSAATGAKFALLPPDNATGNFTKVVQRVPVRIAITRGCGADRPLRPGMSIAAHVSVK